MSAVATIMATAELLFEVHTKTKQEARNSRKTLEKLAGHYLKRCKGHWIELG